MLLAASLMAAPVQATTTTVVSDQEMNESIAFAESMGLGWNLGNSLDCVVEGVSSETCWGNPKVTQKTFDAVAKAGFKCVRIPVSWMGHIGSAPAYRIDKAWMDRVAQVVGYAKKAGLKAIINIHHDGNSADGNMAKYHWLTLERASKSESVNDKVKQQLFMMWVQIAERFKDEGDWLIFETMNEIQDGKWGQGANLTDGGAQYRVLNEWNQIAVSAIRSTGGNNETRYIGIPGYVAQPGLTMDHLVMPEDVVEGRLMVAVHIYDPWDYAGSGKYSEWGHTGSVEDYKNGEADYVAMLDRLYNTYVAKGIPVYLGEYGCVHRTNAKAEEFRKYYLEYTIKAMRERHIPPLFWDNAKREADLEGFGLINHATGKYINNAEEIVRLSVDTWNNTDPAYTLESIYNRAPASAK